MISLKGIDNVFFEVLNLRQAVDFYLKLGFKHKLDIPQINAALLSIGNEEPGLILCEKKTVSPSKMWVEVESASQMRNHCHSMGIKGRDIHSTTGLTFEVADGSDNIIGFADYANKPELARANCREIAEKYARRIWDKKDLSAIEDLLDPKIVIHSLLGDFHGQESMRKVVQAWFIGFPDLIVKNTSTVCEKDLAIIQWQAQGTHQGEFKGIKPTGRSISYTGVTIYRIHGAKITEYWSYLDMNHLLQQIS